MKVVHKSTVTKFTPLLFIFVIALFVYNSFLSSMFPSFTSSLRWPMILVAILIIVVFFILSRLQGYKILEDRLVIQHVQKMSVPFSEIQKVILLDQTKYVRLQSFGLNGISQLSG